MASQDRLDKLYQYALASAALLEDFQQRRLGPIHLLKYAYLADLAYAERNDGATFTGVDWRFYHFGPWSYDAFERVEPAMHAVSASEVQFRSSYADDVLRYGLPSPDAEVLARHLEQELPFIVTNAVSRAVTAHGSDTADLLRSVYLTKPMLAAKPGETLDLRTAVREWPVPVTDQTETPKLTRAEKRRRAEILEHARAEIRRRLAGAGSNRTRPVPSPRHDAVFVEGTSQLDLMAGASVVPSSGDIVFDDSVWNSSQRRDDPDLP